MRSKEKVATETPNEKVLQAKLEQALKRESVYKNQVDELKKWSSKLNQIFNIYQDKA